MLSGGVQEKGLRDMSKLQKKALRIVIWMYIGVLTVGTLLSYLVIFRPLRAEAVERYRVQNRYVLEEMDSTLKDIKEYADYAAYSEDLLQELLLYTENPEDPIRRYDIESTLNRITYVKSGVRGIALHDFEHPILYSLIPPSETERELFERSWYRNIRQGKSAGSFSEGLMVEAERPEPVKVLAYSKNYRVRNLEFTLTVFLDYQEIFGQIERYQDKVFDESLWLTSQGTLLFPNGTEQENHMVSLMGEGQEFVDESDGVYFIQHLYQYPMVSAVYVSDQKLNMVFQDYIRTILVLLIAFFAISLVSVLWIIRKISRPVYELSTAMANAVEQDLNVQLKIDSDDEIGDLSRMFNHMMIDLKDYVQRLVDKEKKEQEMRFGLLASQVDPHFVCNTLNTVNYLAKQKRTEDVVVVSCALSNILRDRLRLKDFQIYDTVDQEVTTVRQYLKIQEYRYGSHVHVEWEIQDGTRFCLIPKNLIQPLIENSLFHGLADEDTGEIAGDIRVEIQKSNDKLRLRVSDNGYGMTEERIREVLNRTGHTPKGRGIGISGIQERLGLLYGEDYEFHILSEPGQGATVEIVIHICLESPE